MGLRDLLGLRRGDKGNNAAAAGRDAYSSEIISEAVPEQGASGSSILDEPVTSGFSTPAGMVSRADLAKMGTGASGVAYNPYTGLGGPFDPQMSKALYTITDSPELLFDEERRAKTRSWGENITFLTGVGYLGGIIAGGGLGAYKGLSSVPEAGLVDTQKLKLNRVLNAAGSRGTSVGNAWGCLGLYYAALDALVGHYTSHEYPALGAVVVGARLAERPRPQHRRRRRCLRRHQYRVQLQRSRQPP